MNAKYEHYSGDEGVPSKIGVVQGNKDVIKHGLEKHGLQFLTSTFFDLEKCREKTGSPGGTL